MDTETGASSSYPESESSTSTREEEHRELYEVAPGTGKPDYGDMKPFRKTFKLERVKKA